MSNPALVLDVDVLRGIFADRDAALVVYDRLGHKVPEADASPLSALAPARLVDLLNDAQLLSETRDAQVWVCEIEPSRPAYLIVDRNGDGARPSILIISSGGGNRWRLLNNLPVGIIELDSRFHANNSNSRAVSLLSRQAEDLLGDGWQQRLDLSDLEEIMGHFGDRSTASLPFRKSLTVQADQPAPRHLDLTVVAKWTSANEPAGYYITLVDVGREHLVRSKLERAASEDTLTHLLNRRTFELSVDRLPEHQKRHLGLAFADLDNFKAINDALGHAAGDELLRVVALRMKAAVRDTDYIGRLGGDEFVIAFQDVQNDSQLEAFGKKLLTLLNDTVTIAGRELRLSTSIGVAHGRRCLLEDVSDPDTSFAEQLIKRADAAMYQAKHDHKGSLRVYSDSLDEELAALHRRRSEYQQALSDGEFLSVFQPILLGDKTVAVEALTRITSGLSAHGSIEQFIETGKRDHNCDTFLDLLTQRAIDTYGGHAIRFDALQGLTLNLNVDVMQMLRPDFPQQLQRWCETARLAPAQVCVEITETALERNPQELLPAFQRLREVGFRLSMDDFGTGYSSIKRLLLYEFDQIKIDRFFIEQAQVSPKYQGVLNAMVALGNSASIQMLAEGIENRQELELCQSIGIELLQGFHLARPAPLAELFDLAPGLG